MSDRAPLVPLSRGEFMSRVGLLRQVEPLTNFAYRFFEAIESQEDDKGHGRDEPWHVSFHGSSFPGDDEKACGRQQLYRMMNVPRGAFTRAGRQFMEAGKDFEVQLVKRYYRSGVLVSTPPWRKQIQFDDSEHWLTCTTDAIVCEPRSIQPFVIEVKNIYAKDVQGMKLLTRGPTASHVKQVKCEIGMANEMGPTTVKRCYNSGMIAIDSWLVNDFTVATFKEPICPNHGHSDCLHEVELLPVRHGWLYYVSRDNMTDTREYYFENDPAFMAAGRRKLAAWREAFEKTGQLPQTNFADKRFAHPFSWKWGDLPCRWCDFGDACREDMATSKKTGKPVMLADSHAIEIATDANPEYDFEAVKAAVLERWNDPTPKVV